MSVSTWIRKAADGRHGAGADLTRGVTRVLSWPYAFASGLLEIVKTGQSATRVQVPVISIGNLTVGGTGKTPLVARLVTDLLAKGRRPVILSRGYAADESGVNDELHVLAHAHPDVLHLQDKDRAKLAVYAADACLGDVLVLDDGFQHHALHRDLNICCLDATNPFGYGMQLPRGLLRESPTGLYRARPVVITRSELVTAERVDEIKREVLGHNQYAKIIVTEMAFTSLLAVGPEGVAKTGAAASSLAGQDVLLASGIGNSEAFRSGVARLGARVRDHVAKGDHHAWTQADADELAAQAQAASVSAVVTTLKDAVKLAHLAWPGDAPPLQVLDIDVRITDGEDVWNALLDEVLKGR
jgi:tetraacyldisaccharide 4'-kinase